MDLQTSYIITLLSILLPATLCHPFSFLNNYTSKQHLFPKSKMKFSLIIPTIALLTASANAVCYTATSQSGCGQDAPNFCYNMCSDTLANCYPYEQGQGVCVAG
ncbi:hypothetical protein HYFRA_00009990 [Hymenoscyphus fraxineus]|uniref:Uncharacterized protein n=1 Tax=Hymenoscyphus fraxineus TaxID=746836 RepID=A0A9N9KVS7_9HELO|nr:hypothetical protein HYFRA_00009990 [Hymenoscyphus fraxineus]